MNPILDYSIVRESNKKRSITASLMLPATGIELSGAKANPVRKGGVGLVLFFEPLSEPLSCSKGIA